ncbi:hypothetical protein MSG28_013001 [Choristoneura fumiferana]|uniref:Uncharacterized protein n=1 Tax=Choristoneura fumiferana TaxID=7141 RepID=A0ACC0KRY0_CHOFU|nr:hypothetical protein MSG28_013001 [Choristoneura fumiferana]
MFVSRRRWILKTCGTTTPLRCLRAVLALARDVAGHARVDNVFYSRREFARPLAQHSPHDNFDSEVELLDSFFGDGRAYIMGPEKDCWYLYTLLPLEGTVDALEKEERQCSAAEAEPDQTLEILMSELDPEVSGIDKIIPGMVIDDFLFDPCGYSMNGVAKDRSCSYVSFESNVPTARYEQVIARVLAAFRPQRFVLTVFATPEFRSLREYSVRDAHYCRFAQYELHYALFAKDISSILAQAPEHRWTTPGREGRARKPRALLPRLHAALARAAAAAPCLCLCRYTA